jgi:hypothetical protein
MILGMSTAAFTTLHVIISLVGIASGLVVVVAMCLGRHLGAWTLVFLLSTVLTSVTGFMFHSTAFGPPHVVGVLSLIVLAIALVALYVRHLRGAARPAYVVTAVLALWLNCFVAVVQAFQKLPSLHALAPTQKEPPFLIAQGLVLAVFVVATIYALKRYWGPPARAWR